jgi:hypothetical protein
MYLIGFNLLRVERYQTLYMKGILKIYGKSWGSCISLSPW